MRALAVILLLTIGLVAAGSARPAAAMQQGPHAPGQGITAQQQQQVDDNDDTRVDVQLVVLAIAAGLVVGVGSLGFALRWKLGRTTYDREAAEKALAHH